MAHCNYANDSAIVRHPFVVIILIMKIIINTVTIDYAVDSGNGMSWRNLQKNNEQLKVIVSVNKKVIVSVNKNLTFGIYFNKLIINTLKAKMDSERTYSLYCIPSFRLIMIYCI